MPYKNPEDRLRYSHKYRNDVKEGKRIARKGGTLRTGDNITCDNCGKEFYRSPANRAENSNRGKFQYCSRECMAKAYVGRNIGEEHPRWTGRITKPCIVCGTLVTRPGWSFARNPDQMIFCSHKCFGVWKSENWNGATNPCWRGGHPPYYGGNWLRQSREARRRDDHLCQFCGISESSLWRALNVHHIKPFRFFGVENCKQANKLSNLISLCESCHHYLEQFCKDGTLEDWPTLFQLGQAHRQTM